MTILRGKEKVLVLSVKGKGPRYAWWCGLGGKGEVSSLVGREGEGGGRIVFFLGKGE